jgi:hypothetical protein
MGVFRDTYISHHHVATPVDGGKHTHVHHNAPTVESVRLLKEMEQAARDKAYESVRLNDNGFECVIHSFVDTFGAEYVFKIIFSLNGKKHFAEVRRGYNDPPTTLGKEVVEAVSKVIAAECIDTLAMLIAEQYGKTFFSRRGE